jgi:hypothetical protein
MASIIKANELQDFGGNSIITSDGAGNVTVNAAAMKNTPAFMAKLSADQTSVSDDTFTKVQFNSEEFDTDNAYDNSTNYRFTVPSGQAGKYFFTYSVDVDSEASSNLDSATTQLKVNNAQEYAPEYALLSNPLRRIPVHSSVLLDLSVGDYVEVFCRIEASDASGGIFKLQASFFGGYKIII